MTSVEFLKNKLQDIAEMFPYVHIRYGYNNLIETHVVELLPLIEYTNNPDLDRAWVPLSLQFIETFNEDVTFISSDSSLSITDITFEFNASCTEEKIITELYYSFTNRPIHYTFPVTMENGKILVNSSINSLSSPVEHLIDTGDIESYLAAA